MDIIEQTIQTYDKIAADYCKKTRQPKLLDWEEGYIRKLLSYIIVSKPLVLDVGCADGRHCVLIDRNGGKAIGIDLSENMLEEAHIYYPAGDFRKMDMRSLQFDDDTFDGIWSSGSIYHVMKSDIRKVIEEFRRVLRVDSVVGINFKLGEGDGLEDNPKSYGGSPRYFAYYSVHDMKDHFERCGFEEIESCVFPEEIYGDTIQQMWFRLAGK